MCLHSYSAVSEFYPLRLLLKLCSSFIPALTAGSNPRIHLCCRPVRESDWDLQTFKLITYLFCLSLSPSLCALFFNLPPPFNLYVYFLLLFFLHHPVCRSVSGRRQIVPGKERNGAGGQQVFRHTCVESLYGWGPVANSGHHLLSCHSLWPKNREWGPVDSWLGARCRERCDRWNMDIIASSGTTAAEKGQGSEAYCQMLPITDDSLMITELLRFQCHFLSGFNTFSAFSEPKQTHIKAPKTPLLLYKYIYTP